ncbi:hypothetical protein [Deinococcus wulumuqiensis]
MRRQQATQGATMIMVVLLTLLLLAGILAATVRLSLGSRQNTADQAATLKAQYAAESQMAMVTRRLQDYQKLLTAEIPGADGGSITHLQVPPGTTIADLEAYGKQFCNKAGVSNPWVATTAYAAARSTLDDELYPDAKECAVDNTVNNAEQFAILAALVTSQAYNVLENADERPSDVNDPAILKAWWKTLLTTDIGTTNWRLGVRALRVVQLTPTVYRFFFGVQNARTRGIVGNATRVMTASRAKDGEWWFQIELPNLLEDVLMTNHHRSQPSSTATYEPAGAPSVNFTDQRFDGSIHTNEKFLFDGSASAQFLDQVSSVGCTDLPRNGRPASGDCAKAAGVYIAREIQTPPTTADTNAKRSKWIADKVAESPRTVSFVKTPSDSTQIDYSKTNFTADYKPLPENESDQMAAANNAGLALSGQVDSVELKAADGNGTPLSTYANSKWNEAAGNIYQYITVKRREITRSCTVSSWRQEDYWSFIAWKYYPTQTYIDWPSSDPETGTSLKKYSSSHYYVRSVTCQSTVSSTVITDEYRYGPDMVLQKKPAGGAWSQATAVRTNFNGVIFGQNMTTVTGPARIGGDTTGALDRAPPALASFAKITLAASGDIGLGSDLTLSQTPCTFSETRATPPCTRNPGNVLGIYSQSGNVIVRTTTPRNVNIHAAIMASTGEATVENYNSRAQSGNVKLIGSLIENWYGAFGQYGSSNTGYGRDFTYDVRLNRGITPPFFPVSPRWNVKPASAVSQNSLASIVPLTSSSRGLSF